MEFLDIFKDQDDVKPEAIVGIYLTELDFIMVKIRLSNGCFLNKHIGDLNDLTKDKYKEIPRDLSRWRLSPF